jgi:Flp pilus assembly pilin Flp
MTKFMTNLKNFGKDEEGAALAEYAILLAIVLALGITALTAFSSQIGAVFTAATTAMTTVAGVTP